MHSHYTAPRSSAPVPFGYESRVRASARGRWLLALQKAGVPGSLLGGGAVACPACGGVLRFIDGRGYGTFTCSGPDRHAASGEGFALVSHLGGLDFGDAVRAVGQALGVRPPEEACEPGALTASSHARRHRRARRRRAAPLVDAIAPEAS